MKSAIQVLKEQIQYFYLIRRLSIFEMKSANKSNYLGMAWEIITPAIMIAIFWLVFGVGIRNRADIVVGNHEVPFIYWLMGGYIVWTFFSQSTTGGSRSIFSRLKIVSKMSFPLSIIPNYVIFSRLYVHIVLVLIVIVILNIAGYPINKYYMQLPYFLFATYALTYSLALITSSLSAMVRDVHNLISSTMRIGIYISPILWDVSRFQNDGSVAGAVMAAIVKLNPLTYLIEGYRAAYFGVNWHFISEPRIFIYFWTVTIALFILGSVIHVSTRRHLIDYL